MSVFVSNLEFRVAFKFLFDRAVMPTQSNVIEAGTDMMRDCEKEWYYGTGDERKGPVTFSEVNFIHIYNLPCRKRKSH